MTPTNPFSVRRLTPADVEQYRDCRLSALLDTPSAFGSSYEEEAAMTNDQFITRFQEHAPESATFGAFDGERVVGLMGIYREQRHKRKHKANLVGVFVRPEYRGQGIGSQLMEATISHAKTMVGVERVELSVESNNTPAKVLYTRHGFTTWGTEPEFMLLDGVRHDEDYMTLKL